MLSIVQKAIGDQFGVSTISDDMFLVPKSLTFHVKRAMIKIDHRPCGCWIPYLVPEAPARSYALATFVSTNNIHNSVEVIDRGELNCDTTLFCAESDFDLRVE